MNHRPAAERPRTLLLTADAALDAPRDAPGTDLAHAALLVDIDPARAPAATLLAAGRPDEVRAHPAAARAEPLDLPGWTLIPGLVNAHAHLDLTHIGPQPHDPAGGFVPWIDMVRTRRHADDHAIAESVAQGVALSLAGGVVAVGDIAGAPAGRPTLTPWRTLAASNLLGVSYLEFFGIGSTWQPRRDRLAELLERLAADGALGPGRVRFGLQPHAPNTVDRRLYRWVVEQAGRLGLPLATHLAESPEERTFVATASGPQRALLERVGIWDDSVLEELGRGATPMAHLAEVLQRAHSAGSPFVAAHANDADDAAIDVLARTGTSVAYCPRASAYFGAATHFGPHRWREMLHAGVNVCLGTDSVINLPAGDVADRGLSVFDECRLLFRESGGVKDRELLAMATTRGAHALGLPTAWFRFIPGGPLAGIAAVRGSSWRAALGANGDIRLLCHGNGCDLTVTTERSSIGRIK